MSANLSTSFGNWLSERRRELDLTQDELAGLVGCSRDLIKKIELGQRRPSRQLAELLAERLAIPTDQRPAFVQFARDTQSAKHLTLLPSLLLGRDKSPQPLAGEPSPNNLPAPVTSFVGREKELADIIEIMSLDNVRLLTLTGPGGTGKTRLALEVASALLDRFAHGVYFVDLAPLTDPAFVISEIAQVLSVGEGGAKPLMDCLGEYLRSRQACLLLDNYEHLMEAAGLVGQLLSAASGLKVLVTSRTPLHIRGEKEYAVPPLQLPDTKRRVSPIRVNEYAQCEAVRLFVERASDVKADFMLDNDNAKAIADICIKLDGLPLAIELAAVRTKVLSPQSILSRLQARLTFLTNGPHDAPARQQTLRRTIEWSYDLLTHGEKQLFRRMAPFKGVRTPEALHAVCNYDGQLQVDVLEGVEALVDSSLLELRQGSTGVAWFRMLETIHEYASEKLDESGEAKVLQREHALWFMRLAEEAEPHLKGARQVEWINRLADEYGNVRAALDWALQQAQGRRQGRKRQRVVGRGTEKGTETETLPEGEPEAEPEPGRGDIGKAVEAAEVGLRTAGAMWRFWIVKDIGQGREYLESLLLLPQELLQACSPQSRIKALNVASELALRQDDISSTRSFGEAAHTLAREAGDKKGMAFSLSILAGAERAHRNFSLARALFEESLALRREVGDKWGISSSLNSLGVVAYQQGDYQTARTLQEESLALDRELEDKRGIAVQTLNLGVLAYLRGDYSTSRSLLEESVSLTRELGDKEQMAWTIFALGKLEHLLGDKLAASSFYKEALAIWKESEFKGTYDIAACLGGLAGVMAQMGPPERAARLLGAAEAYLHASGNQLGQDDLAIYEGAVASARSHLSDEEFDKAWVEGSTMSMEEAIAYALQGS